MMGLRMSDSRHPVMQGGGFQREDYEEVRLQLEMLEKIELNYPSFDQLNVVETMKKELAASSSAGWWQQSGLAISNR